VSESTSRPPTSPRLGGGGPDNVVVGPGWGHSRRVPRSARAKAEAAARAAKGGESGNGSPSAFDANDDSAGFTYNFSRKDGIGTPRAAGERKHKRRTQMGLSGSEPATPKTPGKGSDGFHTGDEIHDIHEDGFHTGDDAKSGGHKSPSKASEAFSDAGTVDQQQQKIFEESQDTIRLKDFPSGNHPATPGGEGSNAQNVRLSLARANAAADGEPGSNEPTSAASAASTDNIGNNNIDPAARPSVTVASAVSRPSAVSRASSSSNTLGSLPDSLDVVGASLPTPLDNHMLGAEPGSRESAGDEGDIEKLKSEADLQQDEDYQSRAPDSVDEDSATAKKEEIMAKAAGKAAGIIPPTTGVGLPKAPPSPTTKAPGFSFLPQPDRPKTAAALLNPTAASFISKLRGEHGEPSSTASGASAGDGGDAPKLGRLELTN
jgi:hypothetical protein